MTGRRPKKLKIEALGLGLAGREEGGVSLAEKVFGERILYTTTTGGKIDHGHFDPFSSISGV